MTRSILRPEYGSLDYTHACAVDAAHRIHGERRGYSVERSLAAVFARSAGKVYGPKHAGVFLLAVMSALDALDVEASDRAAAFGEVADEWWADERHQGFGATSYGAPWSPDRPEPASVTP